MFLSIFLLVILLVLSTQSVQASPSPCPMFFFVIPADVYYHTPRELMDVVEEGIFFLRNGTQFPPPYYLPKDTIARITEVFHCAMFASIITDAPLDMEPDIRLWISTECPKRKKKLTDCYRPRYSENQLTSILPMNDDIDAPSYSPTIRAIASGNCHDRPDKTTCLVPNAETRMSDCHWFDVTVGCREITYCVGLYSQKKCLERKQYCQWRNQKCVSRSRGL